MCHKGQVGECKILFPYVDFISHITVFIIFNYILINKYNIRYYGYGNFY
jgi:hypothetical protein